MRDSATLTSPPRFMDESEVAALTGLAAKTLRNWRSSKLAGPPFVRLGRRVRYERAAVNEWLERQTVTPEGGA